MRSHGLAILTGLTLWVGCQRDENSTERAPSSSRPAAAPQPVQHPQPGDLVDVHGIVVKYLDGGLIEVSGRDRWGNALHTSYENMQFFRNALPVIERGVSAEQAAGLESLFGARSHPDDAWTTIYSHP